MSTSAEEGRYQIYIHLKGTPMAEGVFMKGFMSEKRRERELRKLLMAPGPHTYFPVDVGAESDLDVLDLELRIASHRRKTTGSLPFQVVQHRVNGANGSVFCEVVSGYPTASERDAALERIKAARPGDVFSSKDPDDRVRNDGRRTL
jgi:hypothetical protein